VKWVPERNLVLHAGGNCGVWSKIYAQLFKEVVTFEPNDINFECFQRNVSEPNVKIYKAGLSDKEGFCKSVDGDGDKNYGALQIEEAEEGIPMMTIDSLNLSPDLIQLDVEGFEENALRGARNTIMRSRPIIIIEQKKLAKNGMNDAEIAIMIQRMGYFFAERVWSDNVFIPVEKLS
jgi:FkbM family methyltransferase